MTRLILISAVIGLTACGPRLAGPDESEEGGVTYWEVTSTDVVFEGCTDEANWRSQVQAPTLEPNTFLMYRVEEGGATATSMSCDTTLASSCSEESPTRTYAINDHDLTWSDTPRIEDVTGSTCDLSISQTWTFTDEGETMSGAFKIMVDFVGDPTDCADLEAAVKASSTNGSGMDGCVVTLGLKADFYSVDTP